MKSNEEIFELIRKTLHELFQTDPATVTLETRLFEDLTLDSIDAIDLAARVEEMSGQRVSEDQLRGLRTVGDVVTMLKTFFDAAPPTA
jgi:acyl carrier protein